MIYDIRQFETQHEEEEDDIVVFFKELQEGRRPGGKKRPPIAEWEGDKRLKNANKLEFCERSRYLVCYGME